MIDELKIYCDVDRFGKLVGQHYFNLEAKIADRFAGQMVVITVRGIPRDVKSLKGWYFGGIIPDFLGVLKQYGHDIKPKDPEQRKEAHRMFKEKFIPPLVNEFNQFIDLKGNLVNKPVHTTRNLGFDGWVDFIQDVLSEIESKYGVILKPKKK